MRFGSALVAAIAALILGSAGAFAQVEVTADFASDPTFEAKSADLPLLLGWSVFLDASATQGQPTRYEWCVARPGGDDLCEIYSTDVSFSLLPEEYGDWQIHLDVFYAHYSPSGLYQAPRLSRTIDVKTVIADLSVPSQVYDNEDIFFDGTGSSWAGSVRPDVMWSVDGVPYCTSGSPPTDPNNVRCTLDAALFTLEETHVVALTLSDAESGDSDTRQAEFVVIDDTITVDFEWSEPFAFDPKRIEFDAAVSPSHVDPVGVTWNFGDGTGDQYFPCAFGCLEQLHAYTASGWYTVTATLDVGGPPPFPTNTHEVPVDDPPEPVDAHFTATPQPATVMQDVTFSTDEACAECTFSWSFGDESTSSFEASPVHAYQRSGTFTASLSLFRDTESDQESKSIQIDDCGAAPAINQYGYCFGGEVLLEAVVGDSFRWSTGELTATIQVRGDGLYWVSVEDVGGSPQCWATSEHLVSMDNCGSTTGDANLDETTDAADLGALAAEITDGDGTSVVTSSGGTLTAPGGDVDRDAVIGPEDITKILELLFPSS